MLAAANAPWVAAGLLHADAALTNPVGADVFALRGEGLLPAPLTALGLGGVWNAEVVPATREGVLAVVGTRRAGGARRARRPCLAAVRGSP